MKDIFEIHAPGIDVEDVKQKIEVRVQSRKYEPADLRQIEELSFSPVSPVGSQGFDPALTSELFERPVETPDFRSKKYHYIKGPTRWFATRFYHISQALFRKLSLNKLQAYYHVVHELIAINYRHRRLEEKLEAVLEQNLYLQQRIAALEGGNFPVAPQGEVQGNLPGSEPVIHQEILQLLIGKQGNLNKDAIILCPDDSRARIGGELRGQGFTRIVSSSESLSMVAWIRDNTGVDCRVGRALDLLESEHAAAPQLILLGGLEDASSPPGELLKVAVNSLEKDGFLYLAVKESGRDEADEIFQERNRFIARPDKLKVYLSDLGLAEMKAVSGHKRLELLYQKK